MIKKLTGAARDRKFRKAAEKISSKYAGLFKRLSE